MNHLKVVTLALDTVWADREENVYALQRALRDLPRDTDIVVLPELFSTGFIAEPDILSRMAEDADNSETLNELYRLSRKYNFALAGSMLVRENDNFFNRGFFIEPSGEATFYDKHHLFCLSSEARDLKAGSDKIPVARYRGWNIALCVCYDVRFPVWLRNSGYRYDVLLVPANWPSKRGYAWEHLLIGRAIENQAYVVGVNRSGRDDYGEYDNLTFIYDYAGRPLLTPLDPAIPGAGVATFNKAKLTTFRESFPAANDADPFILL